MVGIFGTYNYGCEAIIRGTVRQIRSCYPEASLVYASVDADTDRRRLRGCDVEILPIRLKSRYCPRKFWAKALSLVGVRYDYCQFRDMEMFRRYDYVFSIGGDMYTLFANGDYTGHLPMLGDYCRRHGIPYLLWGCSVGPFDKNPRAERFFKEKLKETDAIVVRERCSADYLKSLGIVDNVRFLPDPAFYIRDNRPLRQFPDTLQGARIGINLSPLSGRYFGNDDRVAHDAAEIDRLTREYGAEVWLLPHVYSKDVNDDDARYLRRVYETLTDHSRVRLIDSDPGFLALGDAISKLDFIISARMHCCVNAITVGTPAIFLSYSDKAVGMCDYVYGDDRYVIPLDRFSLSEFQRVIDRRFTPRDTGDDLRQRMLCDVFNQIIK